MKTESEIRKEVANYYTEKVKTHGTSPQGVDWNGKESQFLRFEQLCKLIPKNNCAFTILDYGCGYGALVEYLNEEFSDFSYIGFDISEEMIKQANKTYLYDHVSFIGDREKLVPCDYVVASGVFNVKLNTSDFEWEQYIIHSIQELNRLSIEGFAFNMLTIYSDKEYMKEYLYYADPCQFFDFCKKNFSRNVALLHDYNLYEFTIIVKK